MPPKSRRQNTITYNLTSSSARDAFEEELEIEQHQSYKAISGQRGRGPTQPHRSAHLGLSNDLPGHHLTEEHEGLVEYETPRATSDMINLIEIFGATCDRELIENVYFSAKCNFEVAMQQLLTLSSTAQPGPENGSPCDEQEPQTGADASAESPLENPEAAVCHWDMLPPELKGHILGMLNSRDLARAARTNKDFSIPARSSRTNARQLVIPTGVGMMGILSMVAGHPNARSVSLKQWSATPLREDDFTALLLAVSQGSRSSRRHIPVESISFRGCNWMTDGYVMQMCETLQHLKEVDLSDCKALSDAGLLALAKYQRHHRHHADGDSSSSSSDEEVVEERRFDSGMETAGAEGSVAAAAGASDLEELPEDFGIEGDQDLDPTDSNADVDVEDGADGDAGLGPRFGKLKLSRLSGGEAGIAAVAARSGGTPGPSTSAGRPPLAVRSGGGAVVGTPGSTVSTPAAKAPAAGRNPWSADSPAYGRSPLLGSSPPLGGAGTPMTPLSAAGNVPHTLGSSPPDPLAGSLGRPGGMQARSGRASGAGVVGTGALYGSSPVMGTSPFFRTGSASSHNNWIARAAASATSGIGGRGLMSINISGCSNISSDGVKALLSAAVVKACLLQLDISRCPRITRAALVLPATSNLCVLRASACHNLHEVLMQLPLTSPLTELHLGDCKALTKLRIVAPALQQLHVGGCRHLVRLELRCPRLRHLTASLCFRLTDVQLDEWECPRLEHLNCFGCRHLEWGSLQGLLARSPALRHLDLNGCNALTTLDVRENALLQSLDVSGCKALVALRCGSPALQQLTARACPRLSQVSLDSQVVSQLDISRCSALELLAMPAVGQPAAGQGQPGPGAGFGGAPPVGPIALVAAVAGAGGLPWAPGQVAKDGIAVRLAGCDRLPVAVAVRLRQLRERAKAAAAAAAAAAALATRTPAA